MYAAADGIASQKLLHKRRFLRTAAGKRLGESEMSGAGYAGAMTACNALSYPCNY